MAGNLISTTPKISMHALAHRGIMVYTCYSQIRDMLTRKFGDEFALLFAQPVENQGDGQIDWYASVGGQATKLFDLPEDERRVALQKLAHAADEILRFAEELVQKGSPRDLTRGNILKLALRYPDDNALYVAGQQPVFTCWGFGPGSPGVEGKYLTRLGEALVSQSVASQELKCPAEMSSRPDAPMAEPEETPSRTQEPVAGRSEAQTSRFFDRGWLWWLFPLLAALLLFFLLFSRFGSIEHLSSVAFFEWKDFPLLSSGNAGELARLQAEVDALEKRVGEHAAMCVPEREAKPERTPPVVFAKEPGEILVIPEHTRNIDFLAGEWLCGTGLENALTGEPVQFFFAFNKNGEGEGVVYERDEACVGKASGVLENGILRVNFGEQKCDKSNRAYQPITIECGNAFQRGGTICRGINMDGSSWEANFQKLR